MSKIPSFSEIDARLGSFGSKLQQHRENRGWTTHTMAQQVIALAQGESVALARRLEEEKAAVSKELEFQQKALEEIETLKTIDRHTIRKWEKDEETPSAYTVTLLANLLFTKDQGDKKAEFITVASETRRKSKALKRNYIATLGENTFGNKLFELREDAGFNGTQLADLLKSDVSQTPVEELQKKIHVLQARQKELNELSTLSFIVVDGIGAEKKYALQDIDGHVIRVIEAGAFPSKPFYNALKAALNNHSALTADDERTLEAAYNESVVQLASRGANMKPYLEETAPHHAVARAADKPTAPAPEKIPSRTEVLRHAAHTDKPDAPATVIAPVRTEVPTAVTVTASATVSKAPEAVLPPAAETIPPAAEPPAAPTIITLTPPELSGTTEIVKTKPLPGGFSEAITKARETAASPGQPQALERFKLLPKTDNPIARYAYLYKEIFAQFGLKPPSYEIRDGTIIDNDKNGSRAELVSRTSKYQLSGLLRPFSLQELPDNIISTLVAKTADQEYMKEICKAYNEQTRIIANLLFNNNRPLQSAKAELLNELSERGYTVRNLGAQNVLNINSVGRFEQFINGHVPDMNEMPSAQKYFNQLATQTFTRDDPGMGLKSGRHGHGWAKAFADFFSAHEAARKAYAAKGGEFRDKLLEISNQATLSDKDRRLAEDLIRLRWFNSNTPGDMNDGEKAGLKALEKKFNNEPSLRAAVELLESEKRQSLVGGASLNGGIGA